MLHRQMFWLVFFVLPVQNAYTQAISAGSQITVRIEQGISTGSAIAGQKISVRIAKALRQDGRTITPSGCELQGRVDFVAPSTATEDGWMRLVFTSLVFPDGHSAPAYASTSLTRKSPNRGLDFLLWMSGGAAAGALVGGERARISGLLGGLLAGLLVAQRIHQNGREFTLHAGQTVRVRLSSDIKKQ